MKRNTPRKQQVRPQTLADLVATVSKLTHNDRLAAFVVADMINSHLVNLEGRYHGRRVVVS